MKQKLWKLLAVAAVLGFVTFAFASFRSNLTPYVSFQSARAAKGTVQVAGSLVPGSSRYDAATQTLEFRLAEAETREELLVRYRGLRPSNFEEAISIVAVGKYRPQKGVFESHQLLVKCPSKYQGSEVKEYRN
jgi:cytochrome c-type biogenesis protein CcmE